MPRTALPLLALLVPVLLVPDAVAQEQYKRVHQRALRRLLSGEVERVMKDMRAYAEENPRDAETPFVLGLAHAHEGRAEEAIASFRRALELGLPRGRLAAGPRILIENIVEEPGYLELIEGLGNAPIHGPMVGHVGPTSAKIWLRTATEGQVSVVVGRKRDLSDGIEAGGMSMWFFDYQTVVEVEGLEPDTLYYYAVRVNGEGELATDASRSFRTAPAEGDATRFTLAFGGGAGYVPKHETMWSRIGTFAPDLLLLLGDNVYSDDPETRDVQLYCYYRRQSQPSFRGLVGRTPVYTIWDDHDFGTNDCHGGPSHESPAWKPTVWRTFQEQWANPGYGAGLEAPGCWYDFTRGDVHFILLDGRYFRTNPKKPNPTMLGPVQKAWLLERLAASTGTFKVLCSPVPWDYRTKGDSLDTWNGFRDERDEIFGFLAENRIEGVVLMSADRHRSDAWRIEREGAYDLYELNSSKLTNQHTHKTMKEAIFSYNAMPSFGLVEFDTTVEDPTVTYTVVNLEGERVHELVVRRSQLVHP